MWENAFLPLFRNGHWKIRLQKLLAQKDFRPKEAWPLCDTWVSTQPWTHMGCFKNFTSSSHRTKPRNKPNCRGSIYHHHKKIVIVNVDITRYTGRWNKRWRSKLACLLFISCHYFIFLFSHLSVGCAVIKAKSKTCYVEKLNVLEKHFPFHSFSIHQKMYSLAAEAAGVAQIAC